MKSIVVSGAESQVFGQRTAKALSYWCLGWLIMIAADYMELTWRFIAELDGFQFVLFVSPSFWLWIGTFATVLVVVHRLMQMPWCRFEPGLSLAKAGTLIVTLPVLLWLLLHETIPYFYPALDGYVRLIPFLGGKGYL
jgi:hypothetical protein